MTERYKPEKWKYSDLAEMSLQDLYHLIIEAEKIYHKRAHEQVCLCKKKIEENCPIV